MDKKEEKFKPVVGIMDEEILYLRFYSYFSKNYALLKKDKNNLDYIILSGLFLHLTLESYITWTTRWLLKNTNRHKNRRLVAIWENHFENDASLNKKIKFFSDSFLANEDKPEVKKIEKFANKLGNLRNKIVHGHEFSVMRWSNNTKVKTELAKLLTFKEVETYYNDFLDCMKIFSSLFRKIDMEDMTAGLPSKEWVINELTFHR